MKFHGITMVGPFISQKLSSLPTFDAARDQGRIVWIVDGTIWYGSDVEWVNFASGDGDASEVEDLYSDLLRTTIFMNASYDGFTDTSLMTTSTMTHMIKDKLFEYTDGQYIESTNLFDASTGMSYVDYVLVSVDLVGDSTGIIQVSSNGGVDWFTVGNNKVYRIPSDKVGNDLRLRLIGTGSGSVSSWGVIYNKDLSAACTKYGLTYISFEANEGQTMFEVDHSPFAVQIFVNGVLMDSSDYTSTSDTIITFTEPLHAGDIVYVLTFSTSLLDPNINPNFFLKRDGTTPLTGDQSAGGHKITDLAVGVDANDAVNVSQLQSSITDTFVTWRVVSSSGITAVDTDHIFVDTSLASIILYAPSYPTPNTSFTISDYSGTFATNNCTIDRNLSKIKGLNENLILDVSNSTVTLVYSDNIRGWMIV
jgi:hypothetical protein